MRNRPNDFDGQRLVGLAEMSGGGRLLELRTQPLGHHAAVCNFAIPCVRRAELFVLDAGIVWGGGWRGAIRTTGAIQTTWRYSRLRNGGETLVTRRRDGEETADILRRQFLPPYSATEVTHFCVRSSHLRPIPRRQTFYCECIGAWFNYRMIQHEESNILQAHCQQKCSKPWRNGAAADITKRATSNTPENRDAQGLPCFLQLLVEHLVLH